jgi:hypothetical protein
LTDIFDIKSTEINEQRGETFPAVLRGSGTGLSARKPVSGAASLLKASLRSSVFSDQMLAMHSAPSEKPSMGGRGRGLS